MLSRKNCFALFLDNRPTLVEINVTQNPGKMFETRSCQHSSIESYMSDRAGILCILYDPVRSYRDPVKDTL